jgi:DNA-directed RNA polymerase subunit RPC12/RpoP
MDLFTASCRHCGAEFVPAIRAGPSGSYRIGGLAVHCPHCGRESMVRARDMTAALSTTMLWG